MKHIPAKKVCAENADWCLNHRISVSAATASAIPATSILILAAETVEPRLIFNTTVVWPPFSAISVRCLEQPSMARDVICCYVIENTSAVDASLLNRSQNATTTSCRAGQRYILCTSNQCWLAGQVLLVTTRFSTGE